MKPYFLLMSVVFFMMACRQEVKKTSAENSVKPLTQNLHKGWTFNNDASSIEWTGYKTTGKIAVNGSFQNFEINSIKTIDNLLKAIAHARVRINVYSIFSNDETRDKKLITYLFETMTDTRFIEARIEKIDTSQNMAMVNINMNAHEKVVPMSVQIDAQKGIVTLNGTIDLIKDFAADSSLQALHKACYDLHTGKDGVSKTWSEVSVKARLVFEKDKK